MNTKWEEEFDKEFIQEGKDCDICHHDHGYSEDSGKGIKAFIKDQITKAQQEIDVSDIPFRN